MYPEVSDMEVGPRVSMLQSKKRGTCENLSHLLIVAKQWLIKVRRRALWLTTEGQGCHYLLHKLWNKYDKNIHEGYDLCRDLDKAETRFTIPMKEIIFFLPPMRIQKKNMHNHNPTLIIYKK